MNTKQTAELESELNMTPVVPAQPDGLVIIPATVSDVSRWDANATEKRIALNILLNKAPVPEWLKKNPYAGDSLYMPIDKTEYLLTRLFTDWFFTVKDVKLIGNAVQVAGTLYYRPVVDELSEKIESLERTSGDQQLIRELYSIKYTRKKKDWYDHQDGVGAKNLQVESGEKASDFDKIKSAAVVIAVPIAKVAAIKDAADNIGRIFGKDLNRKDIVNYDSLAKDERISGAKAVQR